MPDFRQDVVEEAEPLADDQLSDVEAVSLKAVESGDGWCRFEGGVLLQRTGSLGYTVRVLPRHDDQVRL